MHVGHFRYYAPLPSEGKVTSSNLVGRATCVDVQ